MDRDELDATANAIRDAIAAQPTVGKLSFFGVEHYDADQYSDAGCMFYLDAPSGKTYVILVQEA